MLNREQLSALMYQQTFLHFGGREINVQTALDDYSQTWNTDCKRSHPHQKIIVDLQKPEKKSHHIGNSCSEIVGVAQDTIICAGHLSADANVGNLQLSTESKKKHENSFLAKKVMALEAESPTVKDGLDSAMSQRDFSRKTSPK